MSGDLRTPGRSITTGTFGAIGVSSLVYMVVIVTFAMAVPLDELRGQTSIMRDLSVAPLLIDIGVIAATLSSAIASILGAPRTLQRLAGDQLVPPLNSFSKGAGAENNPRRAAMLTTVIALATVGLGDLDRVAPIISMFFLASYGMINYATYSEARSANTSFRPTFRWFDWRLSLLGTAACIGVIIAIDPLAGAAAGLAVFSLYRYLVGSVEHVRWSDSTQSFHAAEVRSHLRSMAQRSDSSRDWRPYTVAFAPRDPLRRERLTAAATWIEGGAGFTSVVRIVVGRGPMIRKHGQNVGNKLAGELARQHPGVYPRSVVVGQSRQRCCIRDPSEWPRPTQTQPGALSLVPARHPISPNLTATRSQWCKPLSDMDATPGSSSPQTTPGLVFPPPGETQAGSSCGGPMTRPDNC